MELAQGEVPARETLGARRVLWEQLVDYGKQLRSFGSIQRMELISNLPVGDERAYIYRANYQAGVVRVEFVRAADGRAYRLHLLFRRRRTIKPFLLT